ncbi:MAG: glycosyltransferase family 4 protein [Blastocatellia bacterium]
MALSKLLISKERPDYVICYGYTLKPQVALLLWAIWTKTPFALIGDANYFCDRVTGLKRIAKTAWLRFVTKKAAALLSIGRASKLFWEKYGATASQLFTSCLAVDNEFFRKAGEAGKKKAGELRAQLKFEGKVVFLFVGRLIKRKNVDLVLQAARRLESDRFGIVIVGSGEESESLKRQFGDDPNVFFAGNIAPNELPVFYQMADVLVLPADQEPWGLVINEAMNCGLAVIAHQHCGAAIDLIDAENGIKLQGFSIEELVAGIQLLILDSVKLRAMQKSSQTKIQHWSIDNAAAGIIQAVEFTHRKK